MLNFFDFFELDFCDFLSAKFLLILHFIFLSSFLSVKFLFILHFIFLVVLLVLHFCLVVF